MTPFILLGVVIAVVLTLIIVVFLRKKKNSKIEDIFLISEAGILLAHKSRELRPDIDDDILSGMLTAIQDFIKDALKDKCKSGLKRLDLGDGAIHLKRGNSFYIAVVLSGTEPANLESKLNKTVAKIEAKYGKILEHWDGNRNKLTGMKDQLDELLK